MSLFVEIAIITVIAVLAGFIAHLLRQPVIIGFIAGGFFIGLFNYAEIVDAHLIENLAHIGVALLLFLIGLEMDFRELKHVTIPAFLVGLGQILFTFGLGFVIATTLGFATIPAFYIAIALTFSSTIVVVKLLSEKKDINTLYGRVAIGVLLVQDLVAILVLIFVTGLQGGDSILLTLGETFLKGAGLVVGTVILSRIFPKILDRIGRSQEMLYLFSIAWALGAAGLSAFMGLSIEIGGFLAGLALASSSENFQIASRLRPLRDFFLVLFFVLLGIQAFEGGAAIALAPAVVFALFVLVGNPLIIMFVMGVLGYRARTSVISGLTLAQISEFGLIIMALGLRIGAIETSDVSLVTLVGVFTIFVSSYYIAYSDRIYRSLKPFAKIFEFRKKLVEELPPDTEFKGHVVLIGVNRIGKSILEALMKAKADFVAIDYDPIVVKKLNEDEVPVVYGDILDSDIQDRVGLQDADVVISTIPGFRNNQAIVNLVEGHDKRTQTIVTADDEWHARELYQEGADYVIVPHYLGGKELAEVITKDKDLGTLKKLKAKDLKAFKI